jgi:hypothetical protein
VRSVPGLSQVLSACQLILKSQMTSVSLSIASSERDCELIAFSEEAAQEHGLRMDIERRGTMIVLRFSRGDVQ